MNTTTIHNVPVRIESLQNKRDVSAYQRQSHQHVCTQTQQNYVPVLRTIRRNDGSRSKEIMILEEWNDRCIRVLILTNTDKTKQTVQVKQSLDNNGDITGTASIGNADLRCMERKVPQ